MNTLDIVLGGILITAFFLGFRKGFVTSLLSLLQFVIAGYIAIYYASDLKPYMQWLGPQEEYIYHIAAFIVCFIGVSIIFWMLSKLLTNVMDFLTLGVLNRLLGGTFNVFKYAFIMSFAMFVMQLINKENPWITEQSTQNSYLYQPIASIAPSIIPMISEFIEEQNILDTYEKSETNKNL